VTNSNQQRSSLYAGLILGYCLLLPTAQAAVQADAIFNMPSGVSPVAHEVYNLHMLILGVCAVIAFGVYATMIYCMYAHRKSKGAVAAQFHEHPTVEVLWTTIPFLILVGMAIPATKAMLHIYDSTGADLTVRVIGYQWKWKYEYPDAGISFFSNLKTSNASIYENAPKDEHYLREVDHPLVLPVNKKVRFIFSSADVIHSWWVPDFGWKQDTIPGFINDNWVKIEKPGIYRGQCAELCGRGHGFMPIVVEAKTEPEYNAWLQQQKEAAQGALEAAKQSFNKADLMRKGEEVYNTACAACHQAKGEGIPGTFPPIAGSAIAKGPLAKHLVIVIKGKEGTAMMPFGPQLNDVDIAAVITYERNGFGNNTGDLVQPAQVKAAR
jgi:cytochrome c oxidase subunit II